MNFIDLLVALFWIGFVFTLGGIVLYFVIGLFGMMLAFIIASISWLVDKAKGSNNGKR